MVKQLMWIWESLYAKNNCFTFITNNFHRYTETMET